MTSVLVVLLCAAASAGPLAADNRFGGSGFSTISVSSDPVSATTAEIATDKFGRVLIAGNMTPYLGVRSSMFVARLSASGELDPSFGVGGIVRPQILDSISGKVGSLAIGPRGEIILAGFISYFRGDAAAADSTHLTVFKLDDHGNLDPSFSGDGVAMVPGTADGAMEDPIDLEVDRNGRISVLIPWVGSSTCGYGRFCVVRFTRAGALDKRFSSNGIAQLGFGRRYGEALASTIALDGSGDLLVAGNVQSRSGERANVGVARLTAAGRPDRTFAENGRRVVRTATRKMPTSCVNRVTSRAAGRILVAGCSYKISAGDDSDLLMVALDRDGRLERRFASNGLFRHSARDGGEMITDVERLSRGRELLTTQSHQRSGFLTLNRSGKIVRATRSSSVEYPPSFLDCSVHSTSIVGRRIVSAGQAYRPGESVVCVTAVRAGGGPEAASP